MLKRTSKGMNVNSTLLENSFTNACTSYKSIFHDSKTFKGIFNDFLRELTYSKIKHNILYIEKLQLKHKLKFHATLNLNNCVPRKTNL